MRLLLGGILYLLAGCASVGNEARIMPAPDSNWKYASENYLRDNMVEYECSNFKINVWEVFVRSRTYFVGPILPIIPIFYGLDESKDNPDLKIEIRTTNGVELTPEDLSSIIITDNKNQLYAGTGYKTSDTSGGTMSYRVGFDIRRDSATEFKLSFSKSLNNCSVSPVTLKMSDKTGLRFWAPGP